MVNAAPEDFGGLDAGGKPAEDAEKAREKAARTQARAQRLARDERKSKKHDAALAALIASLLGDASRGAVLTAVLDALEVGLPSSYLLGVASLTDPELSKLVRTQAGKMPHNVLVEKPESPVDFDENRIDPQLQLRMNAWFDDIVSSLFSDASVVAAQKFLDLVDPRAAEPSSQDGETSVPKADGRPRAAAVVSESFAWFLGSVNIRISDRKLTSYCEFILDEALRRTRTFLESADPELVSKGTIDLFGV